MSVYCRDGTAPGLGRKPATLEAVSQSSFARDPYWASCGGKSHADKLLLLGLRFQALLENGTQTSSLYWFAFIRASLDLFCRPARSATIALE